MHTAEDFFFLLSNNSSSSSHSWYVIKPRSKSLLISLLYRQQPSKRYKEANGLFINKYADQPTVKDYIIRRTRDGYHIIAPIYLINKYAQSTSCIYSSSGRDDDDATEIKTWWKRRENPSKLPLSKQLKIYS